MGTVGPAVIGTDDSGTISGRWVVTPWTFTAWPAGLKARSAADPVQPRTGDGARSTGAAGLTTAAVTGTGTGGDGEGSAGSDGGKGEPGVLSAVGLAVASVDGAGLGVTGLAAVAFDCDAPELDTVAAAPVVAAALGGGLPVAAAVAAAGLGATGAGTSILAFGSGTAELGVAMLGIAGAAVLGAAGALGLGTGVSGAAALGAAEPSVGSGPGGAAPGVVGLAVVEPAAVWLDPGGSTTSREIFSKQSTRSRIGSCAHARILSLAASVALCANVALEGAMAAARQIQTGFMAVLDRTGLPTLPAYPRAAGSSPQPVPAGR